MTKIDEAQRSVLLAALKPTFSKGFLDDSPAAKACLLQHLEELRYPADLRGLITIESDPARVTQLTSFAVLEGREGRLRLLLQSPLPDSALEQLTPLLTRSIDRRRGNLARQVAHLQSKSGAISFRNANC